jgi:hypothetical protein
VGTAIVDAAINGTVLITVPVLARLAAAAVAPSAGRSTFALRILPEVRGWLLGPAAAIALGYAISWLVAVTAGTRALLAAG